jgi:hypothetical protein
MPKKNKAHATMNEATDATANALKGVSYQDSGSLTKQFNASVDKASKLASAKAKKKS